MRSADQAFAAGAPKRFRPLLGAAVAGFMTLASSSDSAGAEIVFRTTVDDVVIMTLSGAITPLDGALFLEAVNLQAPNVVEIEGPGGDMLSATRIGTIIHERSISTHAIGTCRSACAYIWIAGLNMLATEGVQIANHLPVAGSGAFEGLPYHRTVAIFGWYLGRLNLSVEMMDAFLNLATRYGTHPNQYFDMLAFAQYWNAPVVIVPAPQPDITLAAQSE